MFCLALAKIKRCIFAFKKVLHIVALDSGNIIASADEQPETPLYDISFPKILGYLKKVIIETS